MTLLAFSAGLALGCIGGLIQLRRARKSLADAAVLRDDSRLLREDARALRSDAAQLRAESEALLERSREVQRRTKAGAN